MFLVHISDFHQMVRPVQHQSSRQNSAAPEFKVEPSSRAPGRMSSTRVLGGISSHNVQVQCPAKNSSYGQSQSARRMSSPRVPGRMSNPRAPGSVFRPKILGRMSPQSPSQCVHSNSSRLCVQVPGSSIILKAHVCRLSGPLLGSMSRP